MYDLFCKIKYFHTVVDPSHHNPQKNEAVDAAGRGVTCLACQMQCPCHPLVVWLTHIAKLPDSAESAKRWELSEEF